MRRERGVVAVVDPEWEDVQIRARCEVARLRKLPHTSP